MARMTTCSRDPSGIIASTKGVDMSIRTVAHAGHCCVSAACQPST
jgi:hypothetical protein